MRPLGGGAPVIGALVIGVLITWFLRVPDAVAVGFLVAFAIDRG